jgi:hypothetical protein
MAQIAPIVVEGIPANAAGDIGQVIPTARSKKTSSRREQHTKMTAMAVDAATHAVEGMTLEDSTRITPPVFNVINIDFANQDHFQRTANDSPAYQQILSMYGMCDSYTRSNINLLATMFATELAIGATHVMIDSRTNTLSIEKVITAIRVMFRDVPITESFITPIMANKAVMSTSDAEGKPIYGNKDISQKTGVILNMTYLQKKIFNVVNSIRAKTIETSAPAAVPIEDTGASGESADESAGIDVAGASTKRVPPLHPRVSTNAVLAIATATQIFVHQFIIGLVASRIPGMSVVTYHTIFNYINTCERT